MAKIGLNNFRYGIATVADDGSITYGGAKKPAKAISFNFTPNVSDATLYADDGVAEQDNQVTGGTVTMGVDKDDNETMSNLLGHTINEDGEEISNINDAIPYVGVGRVTRLLVNNVQKFRATVISLVKFSEPTEDETTKGETVEFGTYEFGGTMIVPANGQWRQRQTFDTQAEAIAYIEEILGGTAPQSV